MFFISVKQPFKQEIKINALIKAHLFGENIFTQSIPNPPSHEAKKSLKKSAQFCMNSFAMSSKTIYFPIPDELEAQVDGRAAGDLHPGPEEPRRRADRHEAPRGDGRLEDQVQQDADGTQRAQGSVQGDGKQGGVQGLSVFGWTTVGTNFAIQQKGLHN